MRLRVLDEVQRPQRLPGAQPRHHVQVRQHQRLGLGAGGRDGGVDGHERGGFGGQVAGPELRAVDGQRLLGALTRRSGGRTRTAAPWRRPGAPSTSTSRAATAAARWPRPASPSERSSGPSGFGPATSPCTPVALISAATSSRYCGNFSMSVSSRPAAPRSAIEVTGSEPGARPMPRSMRPGAAASSSANCSATASGAWLGSITPPEPSRSCVGLRGEVGDHHGRAGGGDRGHVVVFGHPVAGVAQRRRRSAPAARSRPARPRWSDRCGRGRGRVPRVARAIQPLAQPDRSPSRDLGVLTRRSAPVNTHEITGRRRVWRSRRRRRASPG